ncbi:MAG: GHKL domain-containing protein [Lachnoclostridium sp.]|nr:GHKL domain-containing protein [Lachnoclostridium sp.]
MTSKFRTLSLEKQLFFSFLTLSALLLFLSLSITLSFNITKQRREIDKSISSIAAYITSMEQVANMLELGYPTEEARKEIDSVYHSFSDLNVIDVYNAEGLRFYHTDRQKIGESLLNGEEQAILNGSAPYITTGVGTLGTQRRAFHAVKDQNGTIIGFAMVSVFTTYISDQAKALFPVYFFILILMLATSVFISHIIVHMLRSSLMGHHPKELLELYLKQDTVLNVMEEGIVASDHNGVIIFANQAAKNLLQENQDIIGSPICDLFSITSAAKIIDSGIAVSHKDCQLKNRSLIYSELPIGTAPNVQGVLTIFNDRSEIEKLSDELSGTKSMLDTLRDLNHEFLNKLHVILGYLQTGETEKAITFITNSNLVSSQAIRQTADCLRVSQICALVIGKMMHAAELGIVLNITPDSRCMSKYLLVPVDVYITIIGNLLENAIEELALSQNKIKEISLGIYMTQECTIISCEDTGRGISNTLLPILFEKGVSTKGNNRGTGLFLIKQALDLYGGEIEIDTEEEEGTIFTVTFTRKELA